MVDHSLAPRCVQLRLQPLRTNAARQPPHSLHLRGLNVLVPQTSLEDGIVAHAWHVLDEKPECSAWRTRQQLLYRALLPHIEAGEFALAP